MQTDEPCPQEKLLKQVLETLGLPESELKNLHDVDVVGWRLLLQKSESFDSFLPWFLGKKRIETISVEIFHHVGGLSTTEEGLPSGEDLSAWAP